MLLGPALGGVRYPDVDLWMAAKGLPGAAAVLDSAAQKYGFRSAAGVPRWGSVAADMVFARASAAGRWSSAGAYEMVGSGVLRYEHDPVTRAPLGVRIEGAATNLLTQSEFPGGLANTTANGFATAVSDIEGGRTGIALNNSTGTAYAYKTKSAHTGPIAFAADIEMADGLPPTVTGATPTFNVLIDSGYTIPPPYSSIRIGAKTWRVSVAKTIDGAGGFVGIVQFQNHEQRRIKVTGYQLEAGSVASSYIVTGASAVTRAAERLYLDLPFDPATDGVTALWDGVLPPSSASVPYGLSFHPIATSSPSFGVYAAGSSFSVVTNGGWGQLLGTSFVSGERRRVVFRLTATSLFASFNGGPVLSIPHTSAVPAGMTRMDIGQSSNFNHWGATIRQVAVWKGAPLSNTRMQELSAL